MTATLGQRSAAQAYARSICNGHKQRYAVAYTYYLVNGGDEPECKPIGYTAAQAIRSNLHSIFNRMQVEA